MSSMQSFFKDNKMYLEQNFTGKVQGQQITKKSKSQNLDSNKNLQQLKANNAQCQQSIQQYQEQLEKLTADNYNFDQQLLIKKSELQNLLKQLQQEQQWENQQQDKEMLQWFNNVIDHSELPQEVIDSLMVVEYQGNSQSNEICLSCYRTMQEGAECKYLPCSHLFHSSCVDKHLKIRNLCPACGEIVFQLYT